MSAGVPVAVLWLGPDLERAAGLTPPGLGGGGRPEATPAVALLARRAGVRALVLRSAWDDLRALGKALTGAAGASVVLVMPAGAVPEAQIQDAALRAGLDVAAVHAIDPELGADPWLEQDLLRLARRIRAAAARAGARPLAGTPQQALQLRLPSLAGASTRRGLFAALRPHYDVVPWVDAGRCHAAGGCALCVTACPAQAIKVVNGQAEVQGQKCHACAICAASCPTGAITYPLATPEMIMAEVTSLLRDEETPSVPPQAAHPMPTAPAPVIAYACPTALSVLSRLGGAGWPLPAAVWPVAVPCAAAAPLYLLLRPLELGATSVAVLTCPARCRFGAPTAGIQDAATGARELLRLFGSDPRRIAAIPADSARPADLVAALADLARPGSRNDGSLVLPQPMPQPVPLSTDLDDRGPAFGAAGALTRRHLPDAAPAESDRCVGSGLPFGRIEVVAENCTLCGLCASVCPTAALYVEPGENVALQFDPLACAACAACVSACPEGAVAVERRLDPAAARSAPRTLATSRIQHCRSCGVALEPGQLVAAVKGRLAVAGTAHALAYLEYCHSCRIRAAVAGHSERTSDRAFETE